MLSVLRLNKEEKITLLVMLYKAVKNLIGELVHAKRCCDKTKIYM